MTDYCNAIAALFAEQRKIPRPADAAGPRERGRIDIIHRILHQQMRELQERAAREFAALNGWRHSERVFSIKTLARGGARAVPGEDPYLLDPHDLLDHGVYFREIPQPYRPIAIVGQPYDTAISVDKATELAHSRGLDLHAPPNPTASWWYPGWTQFFCLTRLGVVVRFLPDQLTFEKRSSRDSDAGVTERAEEQ